MLDISRAHPYALGNSRIQAQETPPIARRVVKITVLLVVSVAILAAITCAVGVERTFEAVGQAGVGAFAAVGVTLLASLVLRATAWTVLNRPIKHQMPFSTLFQAEVVGQAGNIVTPSTYLGGEPLKVIYVGKATGHPLHEVAGTVLLSKYLEMLSFVLFFSFSTVVAAVYYRDVLFSGPYLAAGATLLVVAAGLLAFFGVLWLSLSRRWRPLTSLAGLSARLRLFSGFFRRLAVRTRVMEDQVSRVFVEEGRAARVAFVAFMGTHIAIFVRPAAFFLVGARIGLGMGPLCLLFVATQSLLCFQLTPSGVGTLDGGLIGTFAVIGFDTAQHAAQCMAYLLCIRFWDLVLIGAGAWLAARVGAQILAAKPPTTELLEADSPTRNAD